MKKIIVLFALAIGFIACKEDKKKTEEVSVIQEVDTKQENNVAETKTTYPEAVIEVGKLNTIFDNGYEFADDLKLDFISLGHIKGDKYQLIYGLDSETDFSKLEKLKVSAVFYAKDPSLFKDEIYKKRKSRQVPNVCKIFSLDGGNVLVQNFEIIPKDFTQVKFYFYNNEGVVNKKMLTVRKINLSK